jgi:hypothetical protein
MAVQDRDDPGSYSIAGAQNEIGAPRLMTIDKVGSTTNGCGWRVVTSSPKMVDEMLLLYERPET